MLEHCNGVNPAMGFLLKDALKPKQKNPALLGQAAKQNSHLFECQNVYSVGKTNEDISRQNFRPKKLARAAVVFQVILFLKISFINQTWGPRGGG